MFENPNRRRIYLLRHGEAAYVADDGTVTDDPRNVPLTDNGRVQARKQSAVLASVDFDRAICSGLPRTRETAMLILAGRDTPSLDIVPELEEINGGDRDQPVADRAAWLEHVANPWAGADHPEATFMGGERFVDFAARVTPAFDAIVADPNWQTLLLVLHGAVNRMIFNHVLGLSWQGRVSIEQDNCCINVIDVDTDAGGTVNRYLIRAVNLTGYDLNKSEVFLTSMEHTASRIAEQLSE
ncbi:MAG: histidine phosphatase family protein [Gammaproteobacteria bacterium]|nr:MAG: histidine phosphatase family protein [Gammaproteobacteria bacterium]